MNKNDLTRRQFIAAASAGSLAEVTSGTIPSTWVRLRKAGSTSLPISNTMARHKVMQKWRELTDACQIPCTTREQGEFWMKLEEVDGMASGNGGSQK